MKILTHFTVDQQIANDFDLLSKKLSINKSRYIENRLKDFIDENINLLKKMKEENDNK